MSANIFDEPINIKINNQTNNLVVCAWKTYIFQSITEFK